MRAILKGKISPLASELGISRKRLQKLVRGELHEESLTVSEFRKLRQHEVQQQLLQTTLLGFKHEKETEEYQYLLQYEIKFRQEFREKGVDLFGIYFNRASEAVGCKSFQPYAESTVDLICHCKVNTLENKISEVPKKAHWDIALSEFLQKKWIKIAVEDCGGSMQQFEKIWQEWNSWILEVTCKINKTLDKAENMLPIFNGTQ